MIKGSNGLILRLSLKDCGKLIESLKLKITYEVVDEKLPNLVQNVDLSEYIL